MVLTALVHQIFLSSSSLQTVHRKFKKRVRDVCLVLIVSPESGCACTLYQWKRPHANHD